MSDSVVVVLSDVEEKHGSNDKGPWTKYTLKDGNGQVVGATFKPALGDAAKSLVGKRVEVEVKPPSDPRYAPDVLAVRPAPEETGGSEGGLSKEEWLAKDRAADKRACIAIAAGALTHTITGQPSEDDLKTFAARTLRVAQVFFDAVKRERDENPSEHVPFE